MTVAFIKLPTRVEAKVMATAKGEKEKKQQKQGNSKPCQGHIEIVKL